MELPPKETVTGHTYAISFETRKDKGYMRALKVTLSEDIVDLDETVRIDLADHPLYPQLERYVLANRRTK